MIVPGHFMPGYSHSLPAGGKLTILKTVRLSTKLRYLINIGFIE